MSTPHRRVLTATQLDTLYARIRDAHSTAHLLTEVFDAMRTMVHDTPTDPHQPPQRVVRVGDHAIPSSQWRAILDAATNRAQQWGTSVHVSLELANYLPASYDDPTVATPTWPAPDHRPPIHHLHLTRQAVDMITRAEAHLRQLTAVLGAASPDLRRQESSWRLFLTRLVTTNFGEFTTVDTDGDLSFAVTTSSGVGYGARWRQLPRYCTTPGCATLLPNPATPPHTVDPLTPPAPPAPHAGGGGTGATGHTHTPSAPARGPQPGEWVLRS
ncbi:MAG: hypothetical protein HYR62_02830 [Actinobacteria bacterium]|nr:hypothetical protein [Actinomycetota bacterium]MBI3687407.1 hypothetical protein [Actinomycetota bacterium]